MPASPSALGPLEIIALLFPVVALLLQLQHRAADSERVERFGFVAGIGLFALLSLSFVLVFVHVAVGEQPVLLAIALAFMAATSVLMPALVVLASETMVETALDLFPTGLPGTTVDSSGRARPNRVETRRTMTRIKTTERLHVSVQRSPHRRLKPRSRLPTTRFTRSHES